MDGKDYTVKRFTKIKGYPVELNNLECPHSNVLIRKLPPVNETLAFEIKQHWEKLRKIAAYTLCKSKETLTIPPKKRKRILLSN
jgi:hypothetical protein